MPILLVMKLFSCLLPLIQTVSGDGEIGYFIFTKSKSQESFWISWFNDRSVSWKLSSSPHSAASGFQLGMARLPVYVVENDYQQQPEREGESCSSNHSIQSTLTPYTQVPYSPTVDWKYLGKKFQKVSKANLEFVNNYLHSIYNWFKNYLQSIYIVLGL